MGPQLEVQILDECREDILRLPSRNLQRLVIQKIVDLKNRELEGAPLYSQGGAYPPNVELSKLVGAIKTATSKQVRAQHWPEVTKALWGEHFWSPSYCVVSTGGAPLEVVQRYVEQQRQPPKSAGRPKTR